MSQRASIPFRSPLVLFSFLVGFACPATAAADARVSQSYGKLPLHFEANRGQTHEEVRFLARGPGYSLYLTAAEAVFVLVKPNPDKKRDWHGKRKWWNKHERPKARTVVLRMGIVGIHPAPLASGLDELPGRANYFVGKDPAQWQTNVPTYAKVHYRDVYPGIDLLYYGNQRQLEYDFIVAPGADPRNIVLDFQGAERLEIGVQGELVLHVLGGTLRQKRPVIYQQVDGVRREIAGGYTLQGENRVGFQMAAYDPSRPLVIDPVLSYSTYLGGFDSDVGTRIAVDATGNAYVTGRTDSTNFPTTVRAFQPTLGGFGDAFVAKLNPTGSALVYSTYLGGSGGDEGLEIALDSDGNAYVTGITNSTNFPTTAGAFQPTSGGSDAFVTKLNSTGTALAYSTYLGGSGGDGASGITVDADGNAYVTGSTNSANFPTTAGVFQTTFSGESGRLDAFVTKVNPTGSALVYSTYFGGGNHDQGFGIAVDVAGNSYVTGSTFSTNFPTTAGAFQPTLGGLVNAFVTKLNATGSSLVYATYAGGNNVDFGLGIGIDRDGNAYVTGRTSSTNFPTTFAAFQPTFGGGSDDAFVMKLNSAGSALVYSTYLGGIDLDISLGIAIGGDGNAYVTGGTLSTDFPTTAGAFPHIFGGSDAFVTKLNPTGSALVYSTYLGGNGPDVGDGIAVDAAGNAYVTGSTGSTIFPTTPGAFQSTSGGNADTFVAKITDVLVPPPPVLPPLSPVWAR